MTEPKRTRAGDGHTEPMIQLDGDTLDELVAYNATIHFEAMSNNSWWIGVTLNGRTWHIDCGARNPNTKAYAQVEER